MIMMTGAIQSLAICGSTVFPTRTYRLIASARLILAGARNCTTASCRSSPHQFPSTRGVSGVETNIVRRALSSSSGSENITFHVTEEAKRRKEDEDTVALVTGANRGIGLEIVRQLLLKTKGSVIATCRKPTQATDLFQLGGTYEDRLTVRQMDVSNQESIDAAAQDIVLQYERLDMLFNVAGILGDAQSTPGPERSLKAMDRDWLRRTMEVNSIGPMMLVAALAPLLERTTQKKDPEPRAPAVIVNFSARVGSISDNNMGGWHSYRMSKAALNMATKGIALELRRRRVYAFAYHPGTTDTKLSEPFQANVKPEKLFTPEYTVSQMLQIVDAMTPELSGGFFAFDGSRIEW